ncbi:hypothetical protein pdam_00025017, partial [Pocillopora damicornis]
STTTVVRKCRLWRIKRDFRASCENLTNCFPQGALCDHVQFQGDAACLVPDDYLNVNAMGLKSVVKSLRSSPSKLRIYLPHGASSFVLFSESCEDLTSNLPVGASSFVVCPHSERWQVFTEVKYGGVTTTLEPEKFFRKNERCSSKIPSRAFASSFPIRQTSKVEMSLGNVG